MQKNKKNKLKGVSQRRTQQLLYTCTCMYNMEKTSKFYFLGFQQRWRAKFVYSTFQVYTEGRVTRVYGCMYGSNVFNYILVIPVTFVYLQSFYKTFTISLQFGVPTPVAASHPAIAVNPCFELSLLHPCLTSLNAAAFLYIFVRKEEKKSCQLSVKI